MVDSKIYTDNSANKSMHYGDKPFVGVLNLPDYKIKKPYDYFEGQKLYNQLQQDIMINSQKANPKKKGVPTIIKLITGVAAGLGLLFCGVKGVKTLISKFKH